MSGTRRTSSERLEDAVAELAHDQHEHLSADELAARVVRLVRAGDRLEAETLRTLGEWDRREVWAREGALTAHAWLAHRTPLTRRRASLLVRAARLVRSHARTAKRLASGAISSSHVHTLARVARRREDAFDQHERTLLQAAERRSPEAFRSVAQQWRCVADAELARDDAYAVHERRHLELVPTLHGSMAVAGELDAEGGEVLAAALDKVDTGPDPVDGVLRPRSLAQRRADALVVLASSRLSGSRGSPRIPATVDVRLDAETLAGRSALDDPFGESLLTRVGPVAPDVIRRLACDASVGRVVTRGKSQVLDLGRRTPVVGSALRRALAIRDGGCAFPGCDRPADWCDAHHLEHWAEGGATSLDNLVLLCRRHHVACHEGGFVLVRGPTGTFEAIGPRDAELGRYRAA